MKKIIPFLFLFFIISFFYTPNSFTKELILSEYSSIKNCKIIEKSDEAAYAKLRCPSKDGYNIYLENFDDRSWLIFKKGSLKIESKDFDNPAFTFQNIVPEKIEWRYKINNGKKQLSAVIYRLESYSNESNKVSQYLNILRLKGTQWCQLGSEENNDSARKLADSDQGCP